MVGAGEGGAGFVEGQRSTVVRGGQAECAGALVLVLHAPAEEGRLLRHFTRLQVLVVIVEGQADHGVGLGQGAGVRGTFRRLDWERIKHINIITTNNNNNNYNNYYSNNSKRKNINKNIINNNDNSNNLFEEPDKHLLRILSINKYK